MPSETGSTEEQEENQTKKHKGRTRTVVQRVDFLLVAPPPPPCLHFEEKCLDLKGMESRSGF
jgi:hypothetical protein